MYRAESIEERITIRESLLLSLQRQYPDLSRSDILHAIVRAGPFRAAVETELLLAAAQRAAERLYAFGTPAYGFEH